MSVTSCMSARERLLSLVDPNSFVEIGGMILSSFMDTADSDKVVLGDGVITGYGLIESNPVYIYCQDSSTLSGTIGEMHAKKIAHIYDLALKVGAPVIGIIDSAGIRLQEATNVCQGLGEIYQKKVLASGVIPQITIVLGNCGGGLAVLTSLSDFTFKVKNKGNIFMNSVNSFPYKDTDKEQNQLEDDKNVDFILEDEEQLFQQVRKLITVIPASNDDKSSMEESEDSLNRMLQQFGNNLNMLRLGVQELADFHEVIEVKSHRNKEMITSLIKLNGLTIGVIGNCHKGITEEGEMEEYDTGLTTGGCIKAVEFIKFCNAFNIPLLSLTSVQGYSLKKEEDQTLSLAVASLTYQFAHATVPKVNLLIGDSYGSAYIAMNSKHIGADMVYSLDNISVGAMDAKSAAKILAQSDNIHKALDKHNIVTSNSNLEQHDIEVEYAHINEVKSVAQRGHIDIIVSPESVRKHLIYAFDMLYTKRDYRPRKKNGTV